MKIIQIGQPVLTTGRQIQAVSGNGIAVAFLKPNGLRLHLNQILSIDLEMVGIEQVATNLTTGIDLC